MIFYFVIKRFWLGLSSLASAGNGTVPVTVNVLMNYDGANNAWFT